MDKFSDQKIVKNNQYILIDLIDLIKKSFLHMRRASTTIHFPKMV